MHYTLNYLDYGSQTCTFLLEWINLYKFYIQLCRKHTRTNFLKIFSCFADFPTGMPWYDGEDQTMNMFYILWNKTQNSEKQVSSRYKLKITFSSRKLEICNVSDWSLQIPAVTLLYSKLAIYVIFLPKGYINSPQYRQYATDNMAFYFSEKGHF